MLSHCISPEDRNLFQLHAVEPKQQVAVPAGIRRRHLQTIVDVEDDSGASGVCSLPVDEMSTEGKD